MIYTSQEHTDRMRNKLSRIKLWKKLGQESKRGNINKWLEEYKLVTLLLIISNSKNVIEKSSAFRIKDYEKSTAFGINYLVTLFLSALSGYYVTIYYFEYSTHTVIFSLQICSA